MTEQTQPTDALLPCPFCGAAAHFEMDEVRWEWVECESCGMQGNRSASLMDDCKPKLAEEWNRRTPPAVAPWRSAVLDLIDDCPDLTLEQDHWLSRRVKELDFATTPQPTQAADSVLEDAARYLFLRDGKWRDTDLEPVIRLQLNSFWDEKIDAARKEGGA